MLLQPSFTTARAGACMALPWAAGSCLALPGPQKLLRGMR